jgi:hypothetical protein
MPLGHKEDARFTAGLWIEVLEVLQRRGCNPTPLDVSQALFRLLHGPQDNLRAEDRGVEGDG